MPALPSALLLDLDGTLIDSETIHATGLARFCGGRGVVISEAEALHAIGLGWNEVYADLRLGERLGVDLQAVVAGTVAAKEILFSEGMRLRVLPGAREVFEIARAAALPVAIVTGSSRRELEHALPILGLHAQRLAAAVCAEDVSRGKPHPDGYLQAARRLGVDPERCLVIEDSEVGIAAGLAAGMRVVASAAGNPPRGAAGHQDQSRAHLQIASLAGLTLTELGAMMTEVHA